MYLLNPDTNSTLPSSHTILAPRLPTGPLPSAIAQRDLRGSNTLKQWSLAKVASNLPSVLQARANSWSGKKADNIQLLSWSTQQHTGWGRSSICMATHWLVRSHSSSFPSYPADASRPSAWGWNASTFGFSWWPKQSSWLMYWKTTGFKHIYRWGRIQAVWGCAWARQQECSTHGFWHHHRLHVCQWNMQMKREQCNLHIFMM